MINEQTVYSEFFFKKFEVFFSPFLTEAGLPKTILEEDFEIPAEKYLRLWEIAGRANPNAGLTIGKKVELNDFGVVGHAVQCSENIKQALSILEKYMVVLAQGTAIQVEVENGLLKIIYHVDTLRVDNKIQDSEFVISSLLTIVNSLLDKKITPRKAHFQHKSPCIKSLHRTILNTNVSFDMPQTAIYFDECVLYEKIKTANSRVLKALLIHLDNELKVRSSSFSIIPKINRIIASEISINVPTLHSISTQLCLSRRTLQRYLHKEGVGIAYLIDNVRMELCFSYLETTDYSITSIAMLLGYEDSASLTRAFRRWARCTPSDHRNKHINNKLLNN